MADEATDAAIAKRFPGEWRRANDPNYRNRSKARQKLRRRFKYELEREAFSEANPDAACIDCIHRYDWNNRLTCSIENDFHGYQIVEAGHFCTHWEKKL